MGCCDNCSIASLTNGETVFVFQSEMMHRYLFREVSIFVSKVSIFLSILSIFVSAAQQHSSGVCVCGWAGWRCCWLAVCVWLVVLCVCRYIFFKNVSIFFSTSSKRKHKKSIIIIVIREEEGIYISILLIITGPGLPLPCVFLLEWKQNSYWWCCQEGTLVVMFFLCS